MKRYPIPVVSAVIKDNQERFLVTKRYKDDMHTFPGGKIEYKETMIQAIYREAKEEIGIDIHTAVPMFPTEGFESSGHYIVFFFFIQSYTNKIINLEPNKHRPWKFLTRQQITNPVPTLKSFLERVYGSKCFSVRLDI